RILGCPRERALGRSLVDAVAALGQTQFPRALQETLTSGTARTITHLALPATPRARVLEVKLLPVSGGLTLVWHDITARAYAEHAVKRNEERLSLAAEGASDGLWELDLRTQSLYTSGRWRAMLGLPATPNVGRADEWFGRVHAEDAPALKEALDA